jgi:4-amino-4-deoxy-L-arabinose transferase-like glycosyltransferase
MAWYLIVVPQWKGNMIVKGMLGNNDTVRTLVDYLQFHLVSTLPESLLNYGSVLFFLAGFYFLIKRKSYRDERFALLLALSLLVLTYFFFEINAIAKAHDYYLFPFYPLLFILVPYGAYHMYRSKIKFFKYLTIVLLLILPFTCYLRFKGRWNSSSPGSNKDLLMYKTELRDAVPKNALVVAGNDESHYIFFYTTVRLNIRWGTPRSPEAAEMFGLGCA